MTETLFDLEPPEGVAGDTTPLAETLDLVDDDTAWVSCRRCGTLTTAAGITDRGHDDPDGRTCARMLALGGGE